MIQDGKFTVIGPGPSPNNCVPSKVIDLGGRTVVPGIIDNHNHIILLGLRPGHDVRIENSVTVREVLGAFEARAAEIPAGEWLTALGGFNINQFVPPPGTPRFPTLAELTWLRPSIRCSSCRASPGRRRPTAGASRCSRRWGSRLARTAASPQAPIR